ncbi:hypothetical protein JTB14_023729 [Gonioctena quinquepunctata]|nr:hypothetical protein JTB14_023729 [Gonioctena quinquepunctata]
MKRNNFFIHLFVVDPTVIRMPWFIVKFSDSEEIEAVPSCWYDCTRKTISHPPFPRNRMEKAIKYEIDPGDDWREYSVTFMRDTLYDNFRTACSKASECCVTSEISEPEYLSDRRRPRKKLNSSEEDSSSDLDIPVPKARTGKYGTNQMKKNIGDSQKDSAPQMDSTNGSHKSNQASSCDPGPQSSVSNVSPPLSYDEYEYSPNTPSQDCLPIENQHDGMGRQARREC